LIAGWYAGTSPEYCQGQVSRSRLQQQKGQTSITKYNHSWVVYV